MRKERVTYFISGLILQLSIFGLIIYWLYVVNNMGRDAALQSISAKLPAFLQDTTIVMIITAAFICISMLCYGAARKLSFSKSFRNLTMGLILLDAILLLWIILALM